MVFSADSVTGRARLRRRLSAAAVIALVASAIVGGAVSAQADPVVLQPGELVVNGDAEQLAAGWTGSLSTALHGRGGYPGPVIVDSTGATGATFSGGTRMFTGVGASSTATQTVSLAPSAAAIDNGQVVADLSAYVGGYAEQHDNATVTYDFRDADGVSLGTVAFGPVFETDRGKVSGFIHFAQARPLAPGTRSVVITISAMRTIASASDGYVDNVSLILDAPSPVAAPDTATTRQDTAVTISPLGNDTAGTGASLVPSSVRLLDGTTPVTTLTTPDGVYQVNTTAGRVVFTPPPASRGSCRRCPTRSPTAAGSRPAAPSRSR